MFCVIRTTVGHINWHRASRGSLGDSWAFCCRYIVPFSYHFACPPFPIILLLKSRETFCMGTFSRGFLCLRSLKRPMLLSKIWLFGGLKHKQLYGSLVLSELTCDRYWQSPLYLFCKLQCIRNRCFAEVGSHGVHSTTLSLLTLSYIHIVR